MRGVIVFGFVTLCGALRGDDATDLAKAARSPYEFAEYINTHTKFDWSIVGKALPKDAFLDPCQQRQPRQFCSAELIEVDEPRQIIVLVHFGMDMYVRFLPEGDGWKMRGTLRSFNRRVAEYRHEIVRLGRKPFLVATVEGVSGSDIGENREAWVDLTQLTFDPVFFNSVEAWCSSALSIGTSYKTTVTSLATTPVETIILTRNVEFTGPCTREPLAKRTYKLVYVRAPSGKFELDGSRTTLPRSVRDENNIHYQALYPPEEFLRTHYAELKKILSGPDSDECFEYFVASCKKGDDCRALKALIAK